jgi:hypothetical protein
MFKKNKNLRKIFLKILIAFALVAVAEYLAIFFLSSTPVLFLKVQGLIAVVFLAVLIKSAYEIWHSFNLDHPQPIGNVPIAEEDK